MAEALSLATAIFQFADHARKVIDWTIQLHGSVEGSTKDNGEIERLILSISESNADMVREMDSSMWGLGVAKEEKVAIKDLGLFAQDLAKDLLRILDGLKTGTKSKGERSVARTVIKAIKTLMKDGDIEKVQQRINYVTVQISNRLARISLNVQFAEKEVASQRAAGVDQHAAGVDQKLAAILAAIQQLANNQPFTSLDDSKPLGDLSKPMESTLSRLANVVNQEVVYPKRLLEDLRYDSMNSREGQIVESFSGTSEWIYEEERCQGFLKWLAVGEGVFWFSGKPGSGKSTLLKHIQNDAKTADALRLWSDGSKLLVSSHYFWISGQDQLQRSLEGFYRNILHQLFVNEPELISILCPFEERSRNWMDRLRSAFDPETLKRVSTERNLKFFFFVDGLDEREEGDKNYVDVEMANIISQLVASPSLRVCTSSRPTTAFEQAFGKKTFQIPGSIIEIPQRIIVHEFTQNDMESLVEKKFSSRPNWQWRLKSDQRWKNIGEVVAVKAEGVWLWTDLVMRDLGAVLGEFGRGEDYDTIIGLLDQYPSDLDELYMRIWEKRVDMAHKTTAIIIFSILLEAVTPVFASDIRLFLVRTQQVSMGFNGNFTDYINLALDPNPVQYPPSLEDLNSLRAQLHNRCSDFLEITEAYTPENMPKRFDSALIVPGNKEDSSKTSGVLIVAKVEFIHRSAREFLKKNLDSFSSSISSIAAMNDGDVTIRLLSMAMIAAALKSYLLRTSMNPKLSVPLLEAHIYGFLCHASRLDSVLRGKLKQESEEKNDSDSEKEVEILNRKYRFRWNSEFGKSFRSYVDLINGFYVLILSCGDWQIKKACNFIRRQWMVECWRDEWHEYVDFQFAYEHLGEALERMARSALESYWEDAPGRETKTHGLTFRQEAEVLILSTKARLLLYITQHHRTKLWRNRLVWHNFPPSCLLSLAVLPTALPHEPTTFTGDTAITATAPFDLELIAFLLENGADVNSRMHMGQDIGLRKKDGDTIWTNCVFFLARFVEVPCGTIVWWGKVRTPTWR